MEIRYIIDTPEQVRIVLTVLVEPDRESPNPREPTVEYMERFEAEMLRQFNEFNWTVIRRLEPWEPDP